MPEEVIEPGAPAEAAAAVADQAAESQAQPAQEGPLQIGGVELPFTLEEISDEFNLTGEQARQWVRARQAQMQAGFTRATQTLAEQREALGEAAQIAELLSSEETKPQALRQLLNRFGYDLPDDDDDELVDDDDQQTDLERRLAALEGESQAEKAQRQEREATEAFQRTVVEDMDRFAAEYGFENAGAVPEHIRDDVLQRAVVLPRLADGRLDFPSAVAGHLAFVEALGNQAQQRAEYLASKAETPNPGVVDGSTGDSVIDLSTREARLRRAEAVAGRHQ